VKLDPEDRPARLTEAKALLAQRKIEYEAAEKLSVKGFRAETSLAASKAALEAAQARIRVAETALADTVVRAPFDGLVDEHMVEIGDFVETGDSIARIVDLDPILVVAQVNEKVVGHLRVGQSADVRLFTGQLVSGRLRFISSVADPATRTFQIELEVDNPDKAIADGLTAELRMAIGEGQAYHVSPAILTLTDDGRIGVKAVDEENRVVFQPVRIVGSDDTVLYVARDGTRIVGSLTLAFYRIPTGLKAWIEDVVVDEAGRGRGVGRLLYEAALAEAERRGAKDVSLTSRPSREAANRLYRRIGFEARETNVYRFKF